MHEVIRMRKIWKIVVVAILLITIIVPLEDKNDGALDTQHDEINLYSYDLGAL